MFDISRKTYETNGIMIGYCVVKRKTYKMIRS